MQLDRGLRLESHRVVAFIGAGGKSSAIRRLVKELPKVIVTTTTKLAESQSDLAKIHIDYSSDHLDDALPRALAKQGSALVTGPLISGGGKWSALHPDQLEALHERTHALEAHLLIEADGARGRSIKAPAEHEPAIPSFADLVVPVVGADAYDQPLSSGRVHRSEQIQRVLKLAPDDRLTAKRIGRLLTSAEGGLKGVPSTAEVRVLVNKVEHIENESLHIAQCALLSSAIGAVLLGEVQSDHPVRRVVGPVAGVVLAAGGSSRLGEPKQVVNWRGRSLVQHAVQLAIEAGLDPIVVVTGANVEIVKRALSGLDVIQAYNAHWQIGQSSSVRIGLQALPRQVEAAVFLLADTPFVPPKLVRSLVNEHRQTLSGLVAPRAGGRRANPVLFDRKVFTALEQLEGDQGGRTLFDRFEVEWIDWGAEILLDIDTAGDLKRLRALE